MLGQVIPKQNTEIWRYRYATGVSDSAVLELALVSA